MSIEEKSELDPEDPSLSVSSSDEAQETPEERPVTRGLMAPPLPPIAGSSTGSE